MGKFPDPLRLLEVLRSSRSFLRDGDGFVDGGVGGRPAVPLKFICKVLEVDHDCKSPTRGFSKCGEAPPLGRDPSETMSSKISCGVPASMVVVGSV